METLFEIIDLDIHIIHWENFWAYNIYLVTLYIIKKFCNTVQDPHLSGQPFYSQKTPKNMEIFWQFRNILLR